VVQMPLLDGVIAAPILHGTGAEFIARVFSPPSQRNRGADKNAGRLYRAADLIFQGRSERCAKYAGIACRNDQVSRATWTNRGRGPQPRTLAAPAFTPPWPCFAASRRGAQPGGCGGAGSSATRGRTGIVVDDSVFRSKREPH
jgi:hypothetical protein